jgi:hypothetical protein
MMKFKVLAGTHIQGGRQFETGQNVTSERNLEVLFPLKFQSMGESESSPVAIKKGKKNIQFD